jgi:hypothetical protein
MSRNTGLPSAEGAVARRKGHTAKTGEVLTVLEAVPGALDLEPDRPGIAQARSRDVDQIAYSTRPSCASVTRPRAHRSVKTNPAREGGGMSTHQATSGSSRDKGVCREELGWLFDTDLFRDRTHRFVETVDCLLGFEDVDNVEAVLALSGNMHQQALEREVG